MNKYKIIAICGKSASGKDTLLHKVVKHNRDVHEIISCTTRPPREGEIHGVNYFFLTEDEFYWKKDSGEMLETTSFRDWNYGTSIDGLAIDKINVGVFNPAGIYNLMNDERVDLYVVQVIASDKKRLLRSLNREEFPDVDEIIRRYTTDKEDFEKFSQIYEPDYTVNNEYCGEYDFEYISSSIVLNAERAWAKQAN